MEVFDHLLDADSVDNSVSYEVPILVRAKDLTRVLLVRTDVLHSLGIPSLGVKLDAMPGRVNTTLIESSVSGVATGSCYELCGRGHRAMPVYFIAV